MDTRTVVEFESRQVRQKLEQGGCDVGYDPCEAAGSQEQSFRHAVFETTILERDEEDRTRKLAGRIEGLSLNTAMASSGVAAATATAAAPTAAAGTGQPQVWASLPAMPSGELNDGSPATRISKLRPTYTKRCEVDGCGKGAKRSLNGCCRLCKAHMKAAGLVPLETHLHCAQEGCARFAKASSEGVWRFCKAHMQLHGMWPRDYNPERRPRSGPVALGRLAPGASNGDGGSLVQPSGGDSSQDDSGLLPQGTSGVMTSGFAQMANDPHLHACQLGGHPLASSNLPGDLASSAYPHLAQQTQPSMLAVRGLNLATSSTGFKSELLSYPASQPPPLPSDMSGQLRKLSQGCMPSDDLGMLLRGLYGPPDLARQVDRLRDLSAVNQPQVRTPQGLPPALNLPQGLSLTLNSYQLASLLQQKQQQPFSSALGQQQQPFGAALLQHQQLQQQQQQPFGSALLQQQQQQQLQQPFGGALMQQQQQLFGGHLFLGKHQQGQQQQQPNTALSAPLPILPLLSSPQKPPQQQPLPLGGVLQHQQQAFANTSHSAPLPMMRAVSMSDLIALGPSGMVPQQTMMPPPAALGPQGKGVQQQLAELLGPAAGPNMTGLQQRLSSGDASQLGGYSLETIIQMLQQQQQR